MSETLLEAAQNPTEAVPPVTPEAPPAKADDNAGKPQQPSSEQPKPAEPPVPAAKPNDAPPAEPAKPAEQPKPEGAPEQYEFKAPEGTSYDPQAIAAFSEAARTANLTQDAAQKLVDAMIPALATRQVEQVAAIHKEWADTVLADKEIGGERGSDQFKQKMGVAKKFVTAFDQDGAFGKLLEDTGLGNHPAVLRVLFRAGKAISEDTFVGRGRGGSEGGQVNPLDVLYPTNKKD